MSQESGTMRAERRAKRMQIEEKERVASKEPCRSQQHQRRAGVTAGGGWEGQ